jgi:hypothetical protein
MIGNQDAAVAYALDLLSGLGGPGRTANDGAAELRRLADAGSAEAAARYAVVTAAGFGRSQSWSEALDWLILAADRGHAEARNQLELLTASDLVKVNLREARRCIDLAHWVRARPTRLLVQSPRIGVAAQFLSPELCKWLITRAGPLQRQALVYHTDKGAGVAHSSRSNTAATFTIRELDLPMLLIRQRIAATLAVPALTLERFSIFRYTVGQSFSRHVDYLDPGQSAYAEDLAARGQRIATFLVYLNEDFSGGETHFLLLGRRFRGAAGDALFFYNVDVDGVPDKLTVHEGAAPTSGEKWLLSQFIRDKDQAPG